jgi:hypothetical protein
MSHIRPGIRIALAVFALLSISSPRLQAQATQIPFSEVPPTATTINFETTPDGNTVPVGTLATGLWASLGIRFDGTDVVGGPSDIRSPPNVLIPGPRPNSAIRAVFGSRLTHFGAWGFDFTMEAFDTFGRSLGKITHTDGSPGFLGADEVGFLGFSAITPIAYIEIHNAFRFNATVGFSIDDFVFQLGPPLPPTQVIAFTEFIEPDFGSRTYYPGDSGEELGFTTEMTPTTGLLPMTSVDRNFDERCYTHQSVNAITTFDTVSVAGYENVSVTARVNVADTGYETDDSLRIFATNGIETIDLLNASGATLTNRASDTVLLYGASIPASWTQVSVVMTSVSNSSEGSEHYHLHGLEVRGTLAIPEPSTISLAMLAAVGSIGGVRFKRSKNTVRWCGHEI